MSFAQLGLAESLVRAVTAEGYTTPTPIQAQSIPPAIEGRDLLGCAQTGTGKTAAFALPVLHRLSAEPIPQGRKRPIRALVLSPTRELAVQIADSFHAYGHQTGLRYSVVVGGVSQRPQTQALQRGVDILVATPGRLCDLMDQGWIDLTQVEIFVLDEADRMLDMGFLPDLKRISSKLPEKKQTLFFSATMPGPIAALADQILRDPVRIQLAPVKATTELIEQAVCFCDRSQKTTLLAAILTSQPIKSVIVFTKTKHGADRVVRQLDEYGIYAEAIHGNKSQGARQRTLAGFKSGRTPVLVATDLAARGIDVDSVSHVINYDLPIESETYVHRIGRTGRAGATGIALSFCDETERGLLRGIERLLRKPLPVDRVMTSLEKPVRIRRAEPLPVEPQREEFNRRPPRPPQGSNSQQGGDRRRPPAPRGAAGGQGGNGSGPTRRPRRRPAGASM
ncbi:MAG: DEAD/DEAH box helicase [Planctomycetaceae bacterium]|nr:DEAD/DEAH box helicase [Planctomycetaceae bacterium]